MPLRVMSSLFYSTLRFNVDYFLVQRQEQVMRLPSHIYIYSGSELCGRRAEFLAVVMVFREVS
jgi:hypothetical protein